MTQSQTIGATPSAGPTATASTTGSNATLRLLLICQAEGMHSRYTELSTEDSGLTARGWEQTNILASWLAAHEKVDVLVCAPQLRSRLTAQRIGQAIGCSVIVQPDLPHQPRIFAPAPGRAEVANRLAPLQIDEQFGDAQTYVAFSEQMATVLARLVEENGGKTLAMVMDGNGVATALRIGLGAAAVAIAVNHTSISELSWHNGRWQLMYANRMEHFPQAALVKPDAPAEEATGAVSKALEEELTQITTVYNRILTSSASLNDQQRDQRLRHLLRFANLPAGLRILDMGTGNGRLALMLADDGAREVVGIDISPAMLEAAEYLRASSTSPNAMRVNYRLATAQMVPFRSEGFDAVTCRLLLHHAHRPEEILRECVRVLRPGGILILADLLAADDPVRRATQNTIEARRNPSHVAIYTADQYRKLLTNAGLTIENEATAVFDREVDDWLNDIQSDPNHRAVVREMVEAGLETDATGLKVRKQGGRLIFDQRLFYVRAVKR